MARSKSPAVPRGAKQRRAAATITATTTAITATTAAAQPPLLWADGCKMVLLIIGVLLSLGLIDDMGRVLGALSRSHPLLFAWIIFGPISAALVLKAMKSGLPAVLDAVNVWRSENTQVKALVMFYCALHLPLKGGTIPVFGALRNYFTLAEHPKLARQLGATTDGSKDVDGGSSGWSEENEIVVLLMAVMLTGVKEFAHVWNAPRG